MKEDQMTLIPYIVHEGSMSRMERILKRLVLALVIAILLLFASNCVWLYAWMQYDYSSSESTETVTVDGKDGVANYIGNNEDITNGSDQSTKSDKDTNKGKKDGK